MKRTSEEGKRKRFCSGLEGLEESLNARFSPVPQRPHLPPVHLTLPGHRHHHPSHPAPLRRHRPPRWARCTNQHHSPHRSSSSPDPQLLRHRPSWAACTPEGCSRHSPSHPGSPPGIRHLHLHHHAGMDALRGSVLATKEGQGRRRRRRVWRQEGVWAEGREDGLAGLTEDCRDFVEAKDGGMKRLRSQLFWDWRK